MRFNGTFGRDPNAVFDTDTLNTKKNLFLVLTNNPNINTEEV